MVRTTTPVCEFGQRAAPFDLPGVDGLRHTLDSARGASGLLVMFICNHCPFVKAVIERIVRDTAELATLGIGSIAIMSNDPTDYPEDGWDHMVRIAHDKSFPFPYVADADQTVAKAYGAVCTPDFFGFDADLKLRYRGRLDASGMQPAPAGATRELFEAMRQVARTGHGPEQQYPSIGCSIKWRDD
ncbi:MAG: thioredoxin family protein [Rhodocyclaceae bacterium]|nr:thioredoxin family protein [Rhodocyclaceae bacterium]